PRGTRHRVDSGGEDLLEIAPDEGANLLTPKVVRVVIAGAERVGPEQDSSLHLGAESLGPGPLVELDQRARPLRPVAVADAIVPGEGQRGLRGCDDVVGR